MKKSPKSPKLPRKCIFCGRGNLSKEHIWPAWAESILKPKIHSGMRMEGFRVQNKNLGVIRENIKSRPGTTATKKIRAVCSDCNNTWMSKIEEDAKEVLIFLISGKAIALTQEAQMRLARWIALKVMVGENNQVDEAVVFQIDRDALMNEGVIPSCMQIFIGGCLSDAWQCSYVRHSALLSLSTTVVPNGGRKNVQTTAIGIGQLFCYSFVSVTDGIDFYKYFTCGHGMVQLWPFSKERIVWPPFNFLSHNNAVDTAMALELLIDSPRTVWKDFQ